MASGSSFSHFTLILCLTLSSLTFSAIHKQNILLEQSSHDVFKYYYSFLHNSSGPELNTFLGLLHIFIETVLAKKEG